MRGFCEGHCGEACYWSEGLLRNRWIGPCYGMWTGIDVRGLRGYHCAATGDNTQRESAPSELILILCRVVRAVYCLLPVIRERASHDFQEEELAIYPKIRGRTPTY